MTLEAIDVPPPGIPAIERCASWPPKDPANDVPKTRPTSLAASWDIGAWNFASNVNYRDSMKNLKYEGDICASKFADGSAAPDGCKLASFNPMGASGAIGRYDKVGATCIFK